ncbi:MAG: short chain dehydrogenase, partial [Myxococcota bacterium]
MSDFLVEAGRNPQMRKAISALGLPLSLPQALARPKGPWTEQPLQDTHVLVAAPNGALTETLAAALAPMGASSWVIAYDDASLTPFEGPGEAYGRPATGLDLEESIDVRPNALIFDATGLTQVAELEAVHRFFRPRIRTLARCGRVIVLTRPPAEAVSIEAGVVARSFGGFIRSAG